MLNISIKFLTLMALVLLLSLNSACSSSGSQENAEPGETLDLIVGTSAGKRGHGLYGVSYDKSRNKFGDAKPLSDLSVGSYGALNTPLHKWYFITADDKGQSQVSSFDMGPEPDPLIQTQRVFSSGQGSSYISLSHSGRHLAVAHYRSATIAVFGLDELGNIIGEPQLLTHSGKSAHPERQEGPHPHWVEWTSDDAFLYAVDLGTDQVMAYPFDTASGQVGEGFMAFAAPPGNGPRHMVFHPERKWVYVIAELSNELVFAERGSDGVLTEVQRVSTLASNYQGPSQASHIGMNDSGTRLYVSNRGANTLGVFEITANGTLTLLQHIDTGGDWPRFFALIEPEGLMFVGNQRSNQLSVFSVDEQGLLVDLDASIEIPKPAYISELGQR